MKGAEGHIDILCEHFLVQVEIREEVLSPETVGAAEHAKTAPDRTSTMVHVKNESLLDGDELREEVFGRIPDVARALNSAGIRRPQTANLSESIFIREMVGVEDPNHVARAESQRIVDVFCLGG
mmetsp:Transcript_591/g.1986  ORF Transcript_591/g.1986 Transcript_591/m.1986 type:complete len:124 (+) Transcript_591:2-373(+)